MLFTYRPKNMQEKGRFVSRVGQGKIRSLSFCLCPLPHVDIDVRAHKCGEMPVDRPVKAEHMPYLILARGPRGARQVGS